MKNAMALIYVRWAGQTFEQGYEVYNQGASRWLPFPVEGVAAFLHEGGIVHMNPEYIPRDYAG